MRSAIVKLPSPSGLVSSAIRLVPCGFISEAGNGQLAVLCRHSLGQELLMWEISKGREARNSRRVKSPFPFVGPVWTNRTHGTIVMHEAVSGRGNAVGLELSSIDLPLTREIDTPPSVRVVSGFGAPGQYIGRRSDRFVSRVHFVTSEGEIVEPPDMQAMQYPYLISPSGNLAGGALRGHQLQCAALWILGYDYSCIWRAQHNLPSVVVALDEIHALVAYFTPHGLYLERLSLNADGTRVARCERLRGTSPGRYDFKLTPNGDVVGMMTARGITQLAIWPVEEVEPIPVEVSPDELLQCLPGKQPAAAADLSLTVVDTAEHCVLLSAHSVGPAGSRPGVGWPVVISLN